MFVTPITFNLPGFINLVKSKSIEYLNGKLVLQKFKAFQFYCIDCVIHFDQ